MSPQAGSAASPATAFTGIEFLSLGELPARQSILPGFGSVAKSAELSVPRME
jgi:hypothetical protein